MQKSGFAGRARHSLSHPVFARRRPGRQPALLGASPKRRLGLLGVASVIYLVVSGGPYGLEDAVRICGPRLALLLCLLVPLTLSLPTALMAAELTGLMPLEGGFYFWVKEALGPFAGFVEAYFTLLYTAVDMAIYPVLFAAYLGFLVPLNDTAQVALGIALVWLSGALNLLGIRPVGNASVALAAVIIAPFAILLAVGFPHLAHFRMSSQPLFGADPLGALGAGLMVVIWNFSGWENVSVVAGEIENPGRNYARAIGLALPAVILGYLLPLMVSFSDGAGGDNWRLGYFSQVGYQIGGPLLGAALGIGGALSAFAVFQAAMLWVSRLPYVLAAEGYAPRALGQVWESTASPARAIVACCIVFTLLIPIGFLALVVLDVFFYMGALALEMLALVRMRKLRPAREGLFVISGGRPALIATATLPMLTWLVTFALALGRSSGKLELLLALVLALAAWPTYAWCRRRFGGPLDR